jgi:hypothetical protein
MARRRTVTVTIAVAATVASVLTGCATPSGGTSDVRDLPLEAAGATDAAAPAPPVAPADEPGESGVLARQAFGQDATPSPAATATSYVPSALDVAGTTSTTAPLTTPGTAATVSQPTGRGYVDAAVENRLPGTPGWLSTRSTRSTKIEGWSDAATTVAGTPVRLYVSATGRTFRIQLLRIGWYGGVGARRVWTSVPVRGGVQKAVRVDPVTRMIEASWKVSAVLPTGGLVAGDYLAKLVGSDGASSFVPLTVREPRTVAAVLMVNSILTWQAYNPWGGANTYTATDAATSALGFAKRSVVASFDRPYSRGSGTGGFLDEEYRLVLTAERLGLRLNYAGDLDLQADPGVLDGASGVALLGHSEYWSRPMREALTAARDAGVNLAFLGANDIYRRIRFQSSPATGPLRRLVNYKDGRADPVKTQDTTADWPYLPFRSPESSLTGVQYRCSRARADLVITDPDSWVFRGLGLRKGQKLPGLVGSEYDRVSLDKPTPRPMQIMAHSPVRCAGYRDFADLTWYTTASGAGVFSAGTLDWNVAIGAPDAVTRTVVTKVTERVLTAIGRRQAGRLAPATDNALSFYTPVGVPLDAAGRPIGRTGPHTRNPTAA